MPGGAPAYPGMLMSSQYVFTMHKLSKRVPPDKLLFNDMNLSFFPGAKIGVLGLNGSGKSTLLKIMAGIDTEFVGEGWVAEGARVGYLEQEPQLDPALSVRDNVMQGVAAKKALLASDRGYVMELGRIRLEDWARLP